MPCSRKYFLIPQVFPDPQVVWRWGTSHSWKGFSKHVTFKSSLKSWTEISQAQEAGRKKMKRATQAKGITWAKTQSKEMAHVWMGRKDYRWRKYGKSSGTRGAWSRQELNSCVVSLFYFFKFILACTGFLFGDGQGGLECCSSWDCEESDTTERLKWTELLLVVHSSFLYKLLPSYIHVFSIYVR